MTGSAHHRGTMAPWAVGAGLETTLYPTDWSGQAKRESLGWTGHAGGIVGTWLAGFGEARARVAHSAPGDKRVQAIEDRGSCRSGGVVVDEETEIAGSSGCRRCRSGELMGAVVLAWISRYTRTRDKLPRETLGVPIDRLR